MYAMDTAILVGRDYFCSPLLFAFRFGKDIETLSARVRRYRRAPEVGVTFVGSLGGHGRSYLVQRSKISALCVITAGGR